MQPHLVGPTQPTADFDVAMRVGEYTSLRNESVKHIELAQTAMSTSLLAAGAFLTAVSSNAGIPQTVLLAYPPLALILSLVWMSHAVRICEIGAYIKSLEERQRALGLGWEHFLAEQRRQHLVSRLADLTAGLIFVGASVVLPLCALVQSKLQVLDGRVEQLLFGLDILIVLGTTAILLHCDAHCSRVLASATEPAAARTEPTPDVAGLAVSQPA